VHAPLTPPPAVRRSSASDRIANDRIAAPPSPFALVAASAAARRDVSPLMTPHVSLCGPGCRARMARRTPPPCAAVASKRIDAFNLASVL
jgi:hypothetical protein